MALFAYVPQKDARLIWVNNFAKVSYYVHSQTTKKGDHIISLSLSSQTTDYHIHSANRQDFLSEVICSSL